MRSALLTKAEIERQRQRGSNRIVRRCCEPDRPPGLRFSRPFQAALAMSGPVTLAKNARRGRIFWRTSQGKPETISKPSKTGFSTPKAETPAQWEAV